MNTKTIILVFLVTFGMMERIQSKIVRESRDKLNHRLLQGEISIFI